MGEELRYVQMSKWSMHILVKEASNSKGYKAESDALKHNISLWKQKQGQKPLFIHTNHQEVTQLQTADHHGVSTINECMSHHTQASPNEVEETRVQTCYKKLSKQTLIQELFGTWKTK